LYRTLADVRASLIYLEKAKNMVEETDDEEEKMKVYFSYCALCANIKDLEQEKVNEVLVYALKSYELSCKLNAKSDQAAAADLLSKFYSNHFPDYDLAWKYANEMMQIAIELDNTILLRDSYCSISDIYLKKGLYKECLDVALKGWEMDTNLVSSGRDFVTNIIYANIGLGDKEQATHYVGELILLYNRYVEKSSREMLSEIEVKYETEKKEMRIASLERERKMYVWLGVAGVLVVFALGLALLLNIRNRRKERRLIASEAIQEGEIGERMRIADDLHDRLGSDLTAVKIGLSNAESLQSISEKLDACMKGLREITNNIIPRSLRLYGMKSALEDFCTQYANLQFHFFGEEKRIRHNLEYTVYCCAKELVNNSLKHSGASTINMQLVQSRKHASLTVQDNGCGFDERSVIKGDGLQNIRNRVASCRGKIDIASTPGKGTETVIELKTDS
jgi:signal transduction histidine kinase